MLTFLAQARFSYLQWSILPKKAKQINQRKRLLYEQIKEKQAKLRESGALDENLKQERYEHPYNYNFEVYLKYTKLVREQKVKQAPKPVSKTRKYDKPKFDLSLTDYYVWPSFYDPFLKMNDHTERIVCKLIVSPKALVHTFGYGVKANRNTGATREFDFEDSNLDKFLVYDYRQTTSYWGKNRSDEFYAKQEYVRPIYQRRKWPSEEEFWESDEPVPFRVNASNYGDFRKFRRWVKAEVEQRSMQIARCASLKSYEERVLEKHGAPEYFEDYNKKHELLTEPAIFKYSREFFLEKGQKLDKSLPLNMQLKEPERLGEDYRVSYEQYKKILVEEQQKQLQQESK